jgi:hypothetical protein
MAGPADIAITTHDDCPKEESGIVDRGLDEWSFSAAPLHEVTPLSCFARLPTGEVIGGAVFYLETLSFQAPLFYESLGYRTTYEHAVYPDGIVRYTMVKHIGSR